MSKGFKDLYNIAIASNISDSISPFISTGEITCVLLSENNNIYKGMNIIEDNKIGDKKIKKMVIVTALGEVIEPSTRIFNTIFDLSDNMEVLIDANTLEYKTIDELMPDYYGTFRVEKEQ